MRFAIALALSVSALQGSAQDRRPATDGRALDQVLDLFVRDGMVYYRALKLERSRLDAYLTALSSASIDSAPRDEQVAFWLNAYNALVLRTVIDHYPIAGRNPAYPARSIRQIPGAFERTQHRVAGRLVTLDGIETSILPAFRDPRLYLALGRGAMDSGRLRSEAFVPENLESQLTEVSRECISRSQCVAIDTGANQVQVSAIFSWRERDFVAAYAETADARFASRSPVERAVLAFVEPKLLTTEREFLAKNQFQVVFRPFDWALNDLTGRGR